MAPTVFGENKKRPRMRSELKIRAKTTARLGDSFANSPATTSINYGSRLKRHLVSIVEAEQREKLEGVINFPKNDPTAWRDNASSTLTRNINEISLDQMDTDDEEVHSIISSPKCPKVTERLELQHEYKKAPSEQHSLFLNSNNNNNKISKPTKPKAVLNNNGKNVKSLTPLCISNQSKNDLRAYADMCEIKNAEGLLEIAIKTIKLIKRNQLLQRRLVQLQMETKEFIASVLSNPENRYIHEKPQEQEL